MDEKEDLQTEPEAESEEEFGEGRMPFMEHLTELRKRFAIAVIAVGIGFAICYPFSTQLLIFMMEPLKRALPEGQRLVYTSLPEAFFTYLKISIMAAVLLALPVIFWQIWKFVAPGLYKNERKYAFGFVIASSVLFIGGAIFGYTVVFPFGFKFFVGFESEYIQPLPALKQYFSFSIRLLLAFGAVFELPIVMFFLGRMGIVTPEFLAKNRKWALLLIFVTGAIFTPPDVVTQVMMAGPLIILYEVSIQVVKAFGKKDEIEDEEEDDYDDEDLED